MQNVKKLSKLSSKKFNRQRAQVISSPQNFKNILKLPPNFQFYNSHPIHFNRIPFLSSFQFSPLRLVVSGTSLSSLSTNRALFCVFSTKRFQILCSSIVIFMLLRQIWLILLFLFDYDRLDPEEGEINFSEHGRKGRERACSCEDDGW